MTRFALMLAAAAVLSVPALACPHGGPGPEGCPCKKGGHMFEQIDADHSDAISREEFDAFHAARFATLDANGDGEICAGERKAAAKAKGPCPCMDATAPGKPQH